MKDLIILEDGTSVRPSLVLYAYWRGEKYRIVFFNHDWLEISDENAEAMATAIADMREDGGDEA